MQMQAVSEVNIPDAISVLHAYIGSVMQAPYHTIWRNDK